LRKIRRLWRRIGRFISKQEGLKKVMRLWRRIGRYRRK